MTEQLTCTHCSCVITLESGTLHDDELICETCLQEETFLCHSCGELHWNHENAGTRDTPLCEQCCENYYTTCDYCGVMVQNDDIIWDADSDRNCCSDCYDRNILSRSIHRYSYKPDPIFYGDGNRFYGVELEIDCGGKDVDNAETLLDVANLLAEHLYIKEDGSLEDGLELVSHPMSLSYHRHQMPWQQIANTAVDLGYRSHQTSTCGLHIHVNRDCFSDQWQEQEACIGRVLYLMERFWEELLRFSRRSEHQVRRWATRYGYKEDPRDILKEAKKGHAGRYTCVNITGDATIEFRIFRGTLKYSSLIAALQLVDAICSAALFLSDSQIASLGWCQFMERLDTEEVPELIHYLRERRLYINDPVPAMEEV